MSRLSFPFAVASLGRSATVTYGSEAHVRQMLELLVFTMPDERVMRPDLGSPARQMVFGVGGGPAALALQAALQAAIQQWLGGVMTLLDLTVAADEREATLDVSITYQVTANLTRGELSMRKELT